MLNVLVIDFDPEVREQAGIELNGGVFDLTFVSDGIEALRLVKNKSYDLILIDLLIPGSVPGVVVVQRLRSISPVCPLIAICERQGQQVMDAAMRAGASDILIKPVQSGQLYEMAQKTIKNKLPLPVKTEIVPQIKKDDLAYDIPMLNALEESEKQEILQLGSRVIISGREKYCFDSQNNMVIISRGRARYWHNQLFLGTIGQGSVIGEAVLFLKTDEKIIVTLEALEETEIRLFQKGVLREYFFSSRRNLLLRLSANIIMSLSHKLMKCYIALERQKVETGTVVEKS